MNWDEVAPALIKLIGYKTGGVVLATMADHIATNCPTGSLDDAPE